LRARHRQPPRPLCTARAPLKIAPWTSHFQIQSRSSPAADHHGAVLPFKKVLELTYVRQTFRGIESGNQHPNPSAITSLGEKRTSIPNTHFGAPGVFGLFWPRRCSFSVSRLPMDDRNVFPKHPTFTVPGPKPAKDSSCGCLAGFTWAKYPASGGHFRPSYRGPTNVARI